MSHEDLWHITRGQLFDLIRAYNYKTHLQHHEMAIQASYIAAFQGENPPTIAELCGVWENGREMTIAEVNEYRLEKARKEAAISNAGEEITV